MEALRMNYEFRLHMKNQTNESPIIINCEFSTNEIAHKEALNIFEGNPIIASLTLWVNDESIAAFGNKQNDIMY
jgi:hypothetical protein